LPTRQLARVPPSSLALSTSLALRPAYIEYQLDGDDGGAAGGGRFAFGTALEAVGRRRFGGC